MPFFVRCFCSTRKFGKDDNVDTRWPGRHCLQFYKRTRYLAPFGLKFQKISIPYDEGLDQKRCGQCGSIDAVLKKSSDRGKTRGPNLSHQSLPPVRRAWDISIKDGAGWFVSLSKIRRQTRQSLTAASSSALTYPVLGVNPECNHSYTVETSYCRPDECLQQHGLPRFEIESVHALNSVCHI